MITYKKIKKRRIFYGTLGSDLPRYVGLKPSIVPLGIPAKKNKQLR